MTRASRSAGYNPPGLRRLVSRAPGSECPLARPGMFVQRAVDAVDYQQFFVEHLSLIDHVIHFVARRHQLAAPDADEFASVVHLKIIENDYAVLRKFQHRSNLNTYLATVIERLFLDHCNAQWGKWRASALAQKRGPLAVQLERLICRDGMAATEAIEMLLTNQKVSATRAELEAIAAELPSRVNRKAGGEDELATVYATGPGVDAGLATRERVTRAEQVQRALLASLRLLSDEEQLVLKLRFVDGLQVSAIARALGADQKALYRRLDGVMRQLRTALMAEGVSGSEIEELVGHPEVVVEGVFGGRAAEKRGVRPSTGLKDG